MTKDEFGLIHHELRLEVELFRRCGKSFQDFFEQIMQKADSSFIMVKPMGAQGDWKADGYSLSSATIYQCYAPEGLTGAEAARKITADFEGAIGRWQNKMMRWVFVWSSDRALPPQAVAALANLKRAHPELEIDHLGRVGLWKIVRALALADREALLGVVPNPTDAPMTTAAEIQVLMKHLGRIGPVVSDTGDLNLTAIAEKRQRNRLSESVANMVRPAMPVARLVREFVTSMPDPDFAQAIAIDLAGRYSALASAVDNPDVIFGSLVEYVLGEYRLEPRFFWAAAGIVAHYFELCDVFER
jgi:hypothetical protein